MARVFVGLSGFSYKEWQGEGLFYPPEIKAKDFLRFYAERYPSVEADGTWYRMPTEKGVEGWIAATPDLFRFAPKMHRNVTHVGRLKPDTLDSVRFFLKRLRPMADADKLGPILIQLPPNMKRNDERLIEFLRLLPRTMADSAISAGEELPAGPGARVPLRYAIEFRNETWHTPEVEALLCEAEIAWVAADTDDTDAQRRDTGSIGYARLRKTEYSAEQLADWARYLSGLGKDAYVFCKHEDAERPWEWADELLRLTGAGKLGHDGR
ncbi:MAG TPA: DUF72 domain-containing protein [Fimbriimonadaceae bacterium]|nr:DUF72 domain-containing protein [Fimbriimonadaceae bacterium]HRJ95216.1 DUF72 domain-containing protein [Fimbriimonadaceae bacterium]